MADCTQNGVPVFVSPIPIGNGTSPDSAYPPTYNILQQEQQKQPPASCRYKIIAICLGVVLLICGAVSQAGACVSIRFYAEMSEVGAGIWCGVWFMAAGAVSIVNGYHGTKKLIIRVNAVISGLALAAAITQVAITGHGLERDVFYYDCYQWCSVYYPHYHYCPCFQEDWETSAKVANSLMVGAGAFALFASAWIFVVACLTIFRKPTNVQMHSTPFQYVNQQQATPLNHSQPITIAPSSSQVVPIQVQYVPNTQQMMTNSVIPNQQVFQVPVQFVSNVSQRNLYEVRNQQVLSVPVQYVPQQQYQQWMMLNHQPPNTIDPPASSQVHEHPETTKDDGRGYEQL